MFGSVGVYVGVYVNLRLTQCGQGSVCAYCVHVYVGGSVSAQRHCDRSGCCLRMIDSYLEIRSLCFLLCGIVDCAASSISHHRMGPDLESSRSKGMRIYFEQEMRDLTRSVITRITHDHTRRDLLGRFTQYNDARLGRNISGSTMAGLSAFADATRARTRTDSGSGSGGGELGEAISRLPSLDQEGTPRGKGASMIRRPSTMLANVELPALRSSSPGGQVDGAAGNNYRRRQATLLQSDSRPGSRPGSRGAFGTMGTPDRKKKKKVGATGPRAFRPIPYKFPAGINDNPLAILEDDVDYLFK